MWLNYIQANNTHASLTSRNSAANNKTISLHGEFPLRCFPSPRITRMFVNEFSRVFAHSRIVYVSVGDSSAINRFVERLAQGFGILDTKSRFEVILDRIADKLPDRADQLCNCVQTV